MINGSEPLPPVRTVGSPLRFPEEYRLPSVQTAAYWRRSLAAGLVATNHSVLHNLAEAIPDSGIRSGATRNLEYKLRTAAELELQGDEELPGRGLAALAAPQMGVDRRAIVAFGIEATDKLTYMTNPVFTPDPESPSVTIPNKCFSIPGVAAWVTSLACGMLTWHDLGGRRHEAVIEGSMGGILGHEIDHLDGELFPDRALQQGRPLLSVPVEHDSIFFEQAVPEQVAFPDYPAAQWQGLKSGLFAPAGL